MKFEALPDDPHGASEPQESKATKFSEVPSELEVVASENSVAIPKETPQPEIYSGRFALRINPIEIQHIEQGEYDTHKKSQIRMHVLREHFLASPEGKSFAWLPQAIEGYVRARTSSSLLPDFGAIIGVAVDTTKQEVYIQTENAEEFGFQIPIKDLEAVSVEKKIEQLKGGAELEPIAYSEPMNQALKELKPHAQYQWDLITKAAQLVSSEKLSVAKEMKVAPVVTDQLTMYINGVGVFIKQNEKSPLFAAVKVTDKDIPLTENEKKILNQLELATHPEGADQRILSILNTASYFSLELAKKYKNKKLGFNLSSFLRVFSPDQEYEFYTKLEKLMHEYYTLPTSKITEEVRKTIMDGKVSYKPNSPFETDSLPKDLEIKLVEAAAARFDVIKRIVELINEYNVSLENLLPSPISEKEDEKRHETMHRQYVEKLRREFKQVTSVGTLEGGVNLEPEDKK